jgi:hypothetical protein
MMCKVEGGCGRDALWLMMVDDEELLYVLFAA